MPEDRPGHPGVHGGEGRQRISAVVYGSLHPVLSGRKDGQNPATRLRTFRYFENAIHTAGTIGAPYALVFPGCANPDEGIEDVWNIAVDSMSRLAEIAQTEGVTIAYEATARDITVITDHKRVMKLIGDCGKDNMAVTIDLMCLAQTRESVQDVYDICGAGKVVNVHYSDGGLLPSGAWEHRTPGEGELDLDAMRKVFDDNRYRGSFGNEVMRTIDSAFQYIVRGGVLLFAIALDAYASNRKARTVQAV